MNQQVDIAVAQAQSGPFSGKGDASWQGEDLSARQREVLDVVLQLMVEEGDGFSMAAVCRRASCSKETLYNWFGDRDGLLTATVQYQASKVRMPELDPQGLTAARLEEALTGFATSWLSVITSDVSAALNRMAISHAGNGKSQLGRIVLENGPRAMLMRVKPLLEAARARRLLKIDDLEAALRAFFGLVVADWQIRKLLGERTHPTAEGLRWAAEEAVHRFLALHAPGEGNQTDNANRE